MEHVRGSESVTYSLLSKRLNYYAVDFSDPQQWPKPNAFRRGQGIYQAWLEWRPESVKIWREHRGYGQI